MSAIKTKEDYKKSPKRKNASFKTYWFSKENYRHNGKLKKGKGNQ